jgi:hypothetical protein
MRWRPPQVVAARGSRGKKREVSATCSQSNVTDGSLSPRRMRAEPRASRRRGPPVLRSGGNRYTPSAAGFARALRLLRLASPRRVHWRCGRQAPALGRTGQRAFAEICVGLQIWVANWNQPHRFQWLGSSATEVPRRRAALRYVLWRSAPWRPVQASPSPTPTTPQRPFALTSPPVDDVALVGSYLAERRLFKVPSQQILLHLPWLICNTKTIITDFSESTGI